MTRAIHGVAVVAAIATALEVVHAASSAPTAMRCSPTRRFWADQAPDAAFFLAVPMPDTVLAGAGDLQLGRGGGHTGPGVRAQIFGQRVRVIAVTGAGAAEASREVVLVPWDFDAACDPVPWASSARWLSGSDTLLIRARQRGPAHRGTPVRAYDVQMVAMSVYDGRPARSWAEALRPPAADSAAAKPSGMNSPAQLFEFLRRRPAPEALAMGAASVLDTLEAWAVRHPEIAGAEPSRSQLTSLRTGVRDVRLMRSPVPMRGTWRLVIRLRSGATLTQWMRTSDQPSYPRAAAPGSGWSGLGGYGVPYSMALVPAMLPTRHRGSPGWDLAVTARGDSAERRWPFAIEFAQFTHDQPASVELKALYAEWSKRMQAIDRFHPVSEAQELPGVIALTANGGATLRIGWDTDGDGTDDVVVEGERLSMEVAPVERDR